jgi:DNA-directed RNA polymerase specialized sigma24 family protein
MSGGPVPDPRAVLANDHGHWITKRLLGYAYKKTSNVARARDVAQEAITLALEAKGWHRWEPHPGKTPERSLLGHLCNIARAIAKDERKSAAARREVQPDPEDEDRDLRVADPAPTVERANLDEAEHRETDDLVARVKDRLDARALGVLQLEEEGVHDASVQAERLDCTVREIYRARERIAHHRDAVLAQHGKAGDNQHEGEEPKP